ncbi:hypothetical protein IVA80_29170 [Bradyrhizobium sp. 139]|uniref:hypothetical protein n=1 Tax=Bradyrhizobium sp. 139 TaxID=2782616 RepID=UPI001FF8FD3E|nr:hypothetical protein [Bradyrhizobium sp. 139]MCK1744781.1 hypothetical protein [Bradyrhizobium sp. 139]
MSFTITDLQKLEAQLKVAKNESKAASLAVLKRIGVVDSKGKLDKSYAIKSKKGTLAQARKVAQNQTRAWKRLVDPNSMVRQKGVYSVKDVPDEVVVVRVRNGAIEPVAVTKDKLGAIKRYRGFDGKLSPVTVSVKKQVKAGAVRKRFRTP